MKGKKVVITGGAGFIGSNLAEELAKENEVVILDNFSTGKKENISKLLEEERVALIEGSITDFSLCEKVFENMDFVFHLAAEPNVQDSIENPLRTNETNILGTLNVLVAARNNNIKKVIYASSSSIYGDAPNPNVETMNPDPTSPYALTKLTGEYYCKLFYELYDLSTVSLRYFNVYGPKQDANSEYSAVIPKFIKRLIDNKAPLIYGDGKQTRDFIFVKDIVKATILAAEKEICSENINIGSGQEISINNLANKIITFFRKDYLSPIQVKPLPGDLKRSLADVSKSIKLLGFKPNYALKEGFIETIKYFVEHEK